MTRWMRQVEEPANVKSQINNQQDCATLHPCRPDVLVRNEGTLFLFCPLTDAAKQWLCSHVEPDAIWFGHALVVEHRYALGLGAALKAAGFGLA